MGISTVGMIGLKKKSGITPTRNFWEGMFNGSTISVLFNYNRESFDFYLENSFGSFVFIM